MRHDGMVDFVAVLGNKSPLRKVVTMEHAADVLSSCSVPISTGRRCLDAAGPNDSSPTGPECLVLADLFGLESTQNP
jgi:hypothetical protein